MFSWQTGQGLYYGLCPGHLWVDGFQPVEPGIAALDTFSSFLKIGIPEVLVLFPLAACLASLSALLFPGIPVCPGVQYILIFNHGSIFQTFWIPSSTPSTKYLAVPGPGFSSACIPTWLSVPIVMSLILLFALTSCLTSCLNSSNPSICPTHSPSNTVCFSSNPKHFLITFTSFLNPLYNMAAAPIFPLFPDPSMYTVMFALLRLSLSSTSSTELSMSTSIGHSHSGGWCTIAMVSMLSSFSPSALMIS
ncbi:hypothetical protein E4T56_gene11134 [Termitomyces sp. T112]|nr:hypothetical protein E4T56_gene11134 [Termitomyces sp. T112]